MSNKGFEILRPRARIVRTLGDELISNETVAVIELVKNSYDADARNVIVRFTGPLEEGKGKIEVIDDGTGMTFKTIKSAWMEPATIIKRKKRKSLKGRSILGEKGIGRFASAKLSEKLTMLTKSAESADELIVVFDWSNFGHDLYLDEVKCSWEKRKGQSIKKHGTILVMEKLNTDWDVEKLRKLRAALSRLISPFKPMEDFTLSFELPEEYKNLSGIVEAPPSLKHPHYTIEGDIQGDGSYELTYKSIGKKESKHFSGKFVLQRNRKPLCGHFHIELRVWDRDRLDELAGKMKFTVMDIRRDLNEAAGISVYRDVFRIMPYGERDNDWLRLDFRRVQNPTMRLSNNQIVGYVHISREKNPALKDQSNREGIIESREFSDLRELVKEAMVLLETPRYKERPRREEKVDTTGLFTGITAEPIMELVQKRLPDDKEAQKIAKETTERIRTKIEHVREVLARYRRLATLGQLIDVVLHDGHSALNKIDSEIILLEKELKRETLIQKNIDKKLSFVKNEAKLLSTLFKRIEPFCGRKRGRPKEFKIEDGIRNAFDIMETNIRELKVKADLPKSSTPVKMDWSELQQIIINLLTNSLYWLSKEPERDRKIIVEIEKEEEGINVIFSDSGPGVNPEYTNNIFEPYFSTKPDGVGLGLTIAGELVDEYGGTLELVSPGTLKGACFQISLRKRI